MRTRLRLLAPLVLSTACASVQAPSAGAPTTPVNSSSSERPFGTLREQAERQQSWLRERMETALPQLMRKHGIEMWVVPMREYNEDPVFKALSAPTTFAARRRTIYVFHDRGAEKGVERLALGGGSQGGLFTPRRAQQQVSQGGQGLRQAELWGPDQWLVLKQVLEERQPQSIALDISRTFAFADGLSHGEYEGMAEALGPDWVKRFKPSGGLPVDLLAWRGADEVRFYEDETKLAWNIIETAFSNQVITPGVTTTQDVQWWMRQRLADLGLDTWFHPSVSVQRQGATEEQLGDNPVIQRGDVLHCDYGVTALRLNTDTQHMGYVLREGETDAPEGLKAALKTSNRLQDIVFEELRPGRTGNEVLKVARKRMTDEGIDGTIYSHPIGLHGHGAGAMVGLWDRQEGVPGNGDHQVMASMWYSIELQATSTVPEWNGQRVRSAQEEDVVIDAEGRVHWAWKRQTQFHFVR
ncbi:Xaa-Pro aminopeptidase family enzyme [Myxococcus stipitatus DSM 14675]|uniref:Xaa-Pro aminopeptidase family enzyme n=1 Tax=Myxococcus stipitatus (strain DSM 14675 / JCM 12634 / Mx s8) TaxID=1278073 RepID=L7UM77_MYXSD|nr:M24 family metallopeptidase [Myxococcus stipitatus]AGC49123.1 Xaa-Pro aminopeptidase family enzyme [Myxococcus stipitatus DSM 14675]